MARTIFKFEVPAVWGEFLLEVPRGADLLTVQMQGKTPQIWAMVDPQQVTVKRAFLLVGTGQFLENTPGSYVGTFQRGKLVYHLFDVGEVAQ